MKPILISVLIILFTACFSDKKKVSFEEKPEKKKRDSVDYSITENLIFWESVPTASGDTDNIYLREILFENKTNRPVYLPIASFNGCVKPIYISDKSLNNRIISGETIHSYEFTKDPNKPGRWGTSYGWYSYSCKKELNANSKETFYLIERDPNQLKQNADSFVLKINYWFDTTASDMKNYKDYSIIKNLYTSQSKLIEIEKFISLDVKAFR